MKLEPGNGGFAIEATDLARLLGLAVDEVRHGLRSGSITSRSERGEQEDEGRFRVTFLHERRQVRLVVNADGDVLHVSRITWPLPSTGDVGA